MILEWLPVGIRHFLFLCLRVENGASFPPPLKKEEEDRLFDAMRAGDASARGILIEHNLRLVAHIIKKYDASSGTQEDLISIGTIGLIKAIDSFDPAQGTRFATYAGKCVQNEILMYFRAQKKFACESSLSDAVEVDKDGNPLTILDLMRVEDTILEEIELRHQTRLALEAIRRCLDERERKIVILRFGLNGKRCATQRQVADQMKISRSYVSRLEKGALQKIRQYMETNDRL